MSRREGEQSTKAGSLSIVTVLEETVEVDAESDQPEKPSFTEIETGVGGEEGRQ